MSPDELKIRQRLKDDFEHYAPRCLKIRPKQGSLIPFALNQAQRHLHQRIEDQLQRTGKVRIVGLKGRQQGFSTYVEGRYYWKVTHRKGVRAFIVTHEDEATKNLFEMVDRYHTNCPDLVRPATGASSEKELSFAQLDSGYKVGTAGNKNAGRSSTIQYFHGSEVASWANADEIFAGAVQAVPNMPGTEIILESTAMFGTRFHQEWQSAEAGEGEYEAVFVPWFWQGEYQTTPPADFSQDDEEEEYARLYKLNDAQIFWRRNKIVELKSAHTFKREYPATAAEAFEAADADSYIPAEHVARARKASAEPYGPLIIGVDPARYGKDRTGIIRRQGRHAFGLDLYNKKNTMEVAGIVANLIRKEKPSRVFIDEGGLGAGVIDRLNELEFRASVTPVNFGSRATLDTQYVLMRDQMYGELGDWMKGNVQIPDSDELQSDLIASTYTYDSNNRLRIDSKEKLRAKGLRSPDSADALALTFAYPVHESKADFQRHRDSARA